MLSHGVITACSLPKATTPIPDSTQYFTALSPSCAQVRWGQTPLCQSCFLQAMFPGGRHCHSPRVQHWCNSVVTSKCSRALPGTSQNQQGARAQLSPKLLGLLSFVAANCQVGAYKDKHGAIIPVWQPARSARSHRCCSSSQRAADPGAITGAEHTALPAAGPGTHSGHHPPTPAAIFPFELVPWCSGIVFQFQQQFSLFGRQHIKAARSPPSRTAPHAP